MSSDRLPLENVLGIQSVSDMIGDLGMEMDVQIAEWEREGKMTPEQIAELRRIMGGVADVSTTLNEAVAEDLAERAQDPDLTSLSAAELLEFRIRERERRAAR